MSDAPHHDRSPALDRWLPLGLLLVALAIRLWGTIYGLPFAYHPDEEHVLEPARQIVATGDLDPGWYRYPDVVIELQAGVQAVVGAFVPDEPVTYPFVSERNWVARLVGRGLTALLGVLSLVLLWRATRRLAGATAGAAALGMGACAMLHVQHSHFITTDVPSAFVAAAVLYATVRGFDARRWWWIAAALAGIAAATKYNAGVVVLAPLAAWIATSPRRAPVALAACGFTSLVAFLLFMPWIVLEPAAWWADFHFEVTHYQEGQVGFSSGFGPAVLARYLIGRGLGLLGLAAVGLGAWTLFSTDRARAAALLAFPIVYFALLSSMTVHADRNLLPITPFVFAIAGVGAREAVGFWARARRLRAPTTGMAVFGVLALSLPLLFRSYAYTAELVRTDTRTEAFAWIVDEVPTGARVCTEYYTPTLPSVFRLYETPAVCMRGEPLLRQGCDIVITSSFLEAMFAEEAEEYAMQLGCYRRLRETWTPLATFEDRPIDIYNDPTIRVLQNPDAQRAPAP